MLVVPATLALGLGLGILIGSQLHTTAGHSVAWRTGWRWAQQHWSTYLTDNTDLSTSSAAHWCNSAHDRIALRESSGPEGFMYTGYEVAPSWDWQQGCIARIRSSAVG
jgi:hypothetical protein